MMTIRVRALVRGAVVSLAAITMVFTVAVVPAYASTPTISMFSPPSGQPGTLVMVTGTGFTGGVAGVSAVTFNDVGTTFNVSDDQHLTATVPIGATTGKIRVTTSDGVGTSVNGFVVPVNPTISSFSPSSGSPGTAVTIGGSGFTGVNGVKFNNSSATFNFVSDAQVMTTVPAGATTGKVTVTTSSGTATSASNFTVSGSSSAPTISSLSPSSGVVGTSVTINGNHFTGVNGVKFNGASASFSFVNDGRVTATVPSGATTGKVTVTTAAGTATSASDFTVTSGTAPTISSFSPSSGGVGTSVTINGNRFTGVNAVRFNGTSASFSVVNDGKVTATVPSGATTGRITVTTTGGTATSGSNFTVTSVAPTISSFSPSSGGVGTSVTINGNRFTGVNAVRFNGTSASFSVANDGRVTATVPSGATTGRITVTTSGGTATSGSNFTVTGGGSHHRSVYLSISGRYASGGVGVDDGYSACSSNVPVVIKRFHHGEWHWLTTTSTTSEGTYRALIGRKDGRFIARAKKITLVNGAICEGHRSSVVHH